MSWGNGPTQVVYAPPSSLDPGHLPIHLVLTAPGSSLLAGMMVSVTPVENSTRPARPPQMECGKCGTENHLDWHCDNPGCHFTVCRECGATSDGVRWIVKLVGGERKD